LVAFAALLGAAFGLRTIVHHRRTGKSGWVVPPTRAAAFGDGIFTVGLACTLAGPAVGLAGVLHPIDGLDYDATVGLGVALLVAGAVLALAAQRRMGDQWRAGIDLTEATHLVTDGVFRIVRNPFYFGMIAAAFGVALIVPNLVAIAGWVALVVGSEIDVRLVEEPNLLRTFGRTYAAYCSITPRFLPRVPVTAKKNRARSDRE
jgi:protein-S-isoprenylcysteine O-methyltransferase Ste14